MMAKHSGGSDAPYIADGLVLWLDGIRRGGVAGKWRNLISGGSTFDLFNVTEQVDHCEFNGSTSYGSTVLSSWELVSNDCTIEVVMNPANATDVMLIFMPQDDASKSTLKALGISPANGIIQSAKGMAATGQYYESRHISSMSLSTSRQFFNGVIYSLSPSNYWGSIDGTSYIGKRSTGNYFNGSIYSIRIYDRILTDNEVLANYAVDRQRFGF